MITASLITQIVLLVAGGTDVNAAANDGRVGLIVRFVRLLSYFTIESNLLVLALAISLVRNPARDGRHWRVLPGTGDFPASGHGPYTSLEDNSP